MSTVAPAAAPADLPKRKAQAAATRVRILDAAVDALFAGGYAGASTSEIQRRAGLSRGGLLHQFGSRDELLVAAVHHLASVRVAALAERRDWPLDPAARIDAAVDAMWVQYRQPYFWVSVELWLAARHDLTVMNELGPKERELGPAVRASTEAFFGPELARGPGFVPLTELLVTSMRGVGLAYALTPDRDPDRDPHVELWKTFARHHLLPEAG